MLATLKLNPAQQHMISGFIDTYLKLSAKELETYKREMATLNEPDQEALMEIETSWKREGRLEGRLEGMAEIVCGQLNHRLGNLNTSIIERVQRLNAKQLKALSQSLLDFTAVGDLEQWLKGQKH